MRRTGRALRSTVATASRVETTETKTFYATDLGPPRGLSAEHADKVAPNRRTIRVGHVEATSHGTLRCLRDGDDVVVVLKKGRKQVGRKLILQGARGSAFKEAAFSVEVDEFIGSPWHELEYTSLWTVQGLREKGQMEASIER